MQSRMLKCTVYIRMALVGVLQFQPVRFSISDYDITMRAIGLSCLKVSDIQLIY